MSFFWSMACLNSTANVREMSFFWSMAALTGTRNWFRNAIFWPVWPRKSRESEKRVGNFVVLIREQRRSWLGHLTRKIVSETTYNVSSGTLNPTIPYYTKVDVQFTHPWFSTLTADDEMTMIDDDADDWWCWWLMMMMMMMIDDDGDGDGECDGDWWWWWWLVIDDDDDADDWWWWWWLMMMMRWWWWDDDWWWCSNPACRQWSASHWESSNRCQILWLYSFSSSLEPYSLRSRATSPPPQYFYPLPQSWWVHLLLLLIFFYTLGI